MKLPDVFRRWRTLSLRAVLVVSVVLPLTTAVVAGGVVVLRGLEQQAIARMEEDVELVARALRLPLSRALERGRDGSVSDALESAFLIGRVYGAHLYDGDGRLVRSFGSAATDEDPGRITELAEGESRQGEYARAGREEVYSYFVPLTSSGNRPLGLLQVTRRSSDIEEYIAGLRTRAGLTLLAGVLVMAGLVLVGHRGAVGRHLDRLLASMSRVEEGDRDHRTRVEGPSEIARLGSGLNTMLDSISDAEAEIVEQREEQLRLQAELRQAEKMAAIGRLSAGVAHELGSPLSSVDGRAQRLLRRSDLDGDAEAEIRALREDAARMEAIVRQLLEFGRGVHGPRRAVPADHLARAVASTLDEEVAAAGVELEVGGPEPPPVLSVDRRGTERALANLVRNAVHASPGGRVELRWLDAAGGRGGFVVADDGPGVEEDLQGRIFEPFFTTKATGEGTGLGLAVVHGVAQHHGGTVEVGRSRWGGASFRVELPLDGAPDAGDDATMDADGRSVDPRRAEAREPGGGREAGRG